MGGGRGWWGGGGGGGGERGVEPTKPDNSSFPQGRRGEMGGGGGVVGGCGRGGEEGGGGGGGFVGGGGGGRGAGVRNREASVMLHNPSMYDTHTAACAFCSKPAATNLNGGGSEHHIMSQSSNLRHVCPHDPAAQPAPAINVMHAKGM